MAKSKNNRFQVRVVEGDTSDPTIPPEIEDREFAKTVLEMMYNLESDWALNGWDQPASFGLLYERSRKKIGNVTQLYMDFREVPEFRLAAMNRERPWTVMVDLAELTQKLSDILPAPSTNLVAVVFIVEAWMLKRDASKETPEEAVEREKTVRERKVHAHQDRVEARLVQVVDKQANRYLLTHERDGIASAIISTADGGLRGDVPNAMHYFLDTALGRDMPTWDAWCELYSYDDIEDEMKRRHRDE